MISAAPGDLDPTFDGDGKATTDFPGGLATGYASARQADGKLVTVGEAAADMFITRRNVDGSLDTTFGNEGLVIIDFAQSGFDSGQAVIILPDGKILVGGSKRCRLRARAASHRRVTRHFVRRRWPCHDGLRHDAGVDR